MKPYMLVKGSTDNINEFEDKVSAALEEGYDFSGDLIVKPNGNAAMLLQPMVLEEEISFSDDDFEDLEDEDED